MKFRVEIPDEMADRYSPADRDRAIRVLGASGVDATGTTFFDKAVSVYEGEGPELGVAVIAAMAQGHPITGLLNALEAT